MQRGGGESRGKERGKQQDVGLSVVECDAAVAPLDGQQRGTDTIIATHTHRMHAFDGKRELRQINRPNVNLMIFHISWVMCFWYRGPAMHPRTHTHTHAGSFGLNSARHSSVPISDIR